MHICHIITKPELGGAQLTTLNLVSELSKQARYEISFISSDSGLLVLDFIKIPNVKKFLLSSLKRNIDPIRDILNLYKMYRILKTQKCELVHTHSSKAGILGRLAARIARTRVVVHTIHGWSFNEYQNILVKRFFIILERIAALWSTKIICVSERDIATGLKYRIANKDKFALIRYGILIEEFQNSNVDIYRKRTEFGITNQGPIVAMISCLKPQKSPLDYIRAISIVQKDIPKANFLIIGDGILRPKVLKLANTLGLDSSLLFKGWRRDIPEIMSVIDVLVLSSLWEGFPVVFLEAMASGKPVIATDVGGAKEVIRDGIDGFLVPPKDYKSLAEKIKTILTEDGLCKKMGQNFKSRLDSSYHLQNMVREVERLYQDLK